MPRASILSRLVSSRSATKKIQGGNIQGKEIFQRKRDHSQEPQYVIILCAYLILS